MNHSNQRFKLWVCFFILVCLTSSHLKGQSITNYVFAPYTSSFVPLVGGTPVSTAISAADFLDDTKTSIPIPIGFPFLYMGTFYTEAIATSDGYLSFNTAATCQLSNDLTNAADIQRPLLAPLWDDLSGASGTASAQYRTTGNEGTRIFTIEWLNWQWNYQAIGATLSFQIKILEATGEIQFRYRDEGGTLWNPSASIGITARGRGIRNFLSVTSNATPTGSYVTESVLTTKPANNAVYAFIPSNLVPATPTLLTFSNALSGAVTLNWIDNSSNEVGFLIQYSTDSIHYTTLTTTTANVTHYVATGLSANTTYYWKVFALSEARLNPTPAHGTFTTRNCLPPGTYTVGATGNYQNLTQVTIDLKTCALTGAYIFELQPNYNPSTETYPIQFHHNLGSNAVNTVVIRPDASVTTPIQLESSRNVLWDMNGMDYLTVDGRPGGVGSNGYLVLSSSDTTENLLQLNKDASHNTFKYLTFKGCANSYLNGGEQKATIYFGNIVTTGNNYNTIEYCEIRDGFTTPRYAIFSVRQTQGNKNNTIAHCNIYNFHAINQDAGGITTTNGRDEGWLITSNHFYQTAIRTAGVTGVTITAISIGATKNVVISNNYIGGTAPYAGGTPWTMEGATFNTFGGIFSTGDNLLIQGNTIKNIIWNSAATSTEIFPNHTVDVLNGIGTNNSYYTTTTIKDNTVGGTTSTDGITVICSNSRTKVNGIVAYWADSMIIQNNIIGGWKLLGTHSNVVQRFSGIYLAASAFPRANFKLVSGNIIGSLTTPNSITLTTLPLHAFSTFIGIECVVDFNGKSLIFNNIIANVTHTYNGTSNSEYNVLTGITARFYANNTLIKKNTIRNLTTNCDAIGTGNNASIVGILNENGYPSKFQGNQIYDLSNTHPTARVSVVGISSKTVDNEISNNQIYNLEAASTHPEANLVGIYAGARKMICQNNMIRLGYGVGGANLQRGLRIMGIYGIADTNSTILFNTVYIGGTNVSDAQNTFALKSDENILPRTIQNNIFVNARSNGSGTGKHYAVSIAGTAAHPVGLNSNYNNYYVSGIGGVLGLFNAADKTTLSSWQTATGQDANGKNSDPLFENPTTPLPNLHLTGLNNPCDGAGLPVRTVLYDFEGDHRSDQTPTDLGADAGNHGFTSTDIGVIGVARPTSLTTCHGIAEPVVVTLRNFSSVPISFATAPVTLQTIVSGGTSFTFTKTVDTGILAAGATRGILMGSLNTNNLNPFTFTTTAIHAADINNANNNDTTTVQIGIPPPFVSSLQLTGRGGYHCIGMSHHKSSIFVEATGGVFPYTYLWSTGDSTSYLADLTPVATTRYQVTITDACGMSLIRDTTIQVIPCLYAPTWTENTPYNSIISTGSPYTSLTGARQEISAYTNTVSLTGTTFKYQGEPVTAFYANEDGFLSFNTSAPISNGRIGYLNSLPTRMLAPYYSNLALKNNAPLNKDVSMRYKIVGTLGSGTATIIIEWAEMEIEGATGSNLNFQVVLHERDNTIDFNYGLMLRYNGTENNLTSRQVGIGLSGNAPEVNSLAERMVLQRLNTYYMDTIVAPFLNGTLVSNAQLKFTPIASYTPPLVPIRVLSNDDPTQAIEIPTNPIPCALDNGNYYSSKMATPSMRIPTCSGTAGIADDDVWFQFTASPTSAAHLIRVSPSYEYDAVVQLLDETLLPIQCANVNSVGIAERLEVTLIPNRRYYLRIYDAAMGASASGEFSICVSSSSVASTPACVATMITPANGSTICNSPTLKWSAVANALNYDIYLNAGDNAPTVLVAANWTDTTYTPTGFATGRYTWKVVPKNANGAAIGCSYWSFDWISPVVTAIDGNRCGAGIVHLGASTLNGIQVQWYDSRTGGNLLGMGNLFITPSLASTTTYYATATASNQASCAVPRVPVTATVRATELTLNTAHTTICAGNWTDTIRVTSPIERFDTYSWSPERFLTQDNTTVRFNPMQTRIYTLNASNRVSGCSSSTQITVHVNERPSAAITGENVICTGGSTLWTASGGSHFRWSTAETTPNIRVTTSGMYKVTVTNTLGCVDSTTKTLTVSARPTASLARIGASTFCQGDSAILKASGGLTYRWTIPAGASTDSIITAKTTGVYKVLVFNAVGCSDSTGITITVNPKPIVSFTITALGGNATFTNTSTGGNTFSWDYGDSTALDTARNTIHTYRANGNYPVKLIVTSAAGCRDSLVKPISITLVSNEELLTEWKALVYPNPTAHELHIEFQDPIIRFGAEDYICVTNAFGQEIYRQVLVGNSLNLNTENWAAGLYRLHAVIRNQKVGLSKVVKIGK